MELPKNITQIGEVGKTCKIYVEDYVVSYMKQLNQAALDKNMAIALYGKRREENGIVYYFMYGACKLDFLQKEVRHLSQAQRQEIERLRKKYFPEHAFVGYRLLDGDMIEGFHICEQDICRYISGYAQFYEKNDAMLAYMLDVREETQPEQVNQEKYEEVKKRQEERRASSENQVRAVRETSNIRRMPTPVNLQRMRLTAVGVFALLCLLGIATFREDELKNSVNTSALDAVATSGVAQKDTLVMEDKLDQVLLEENQSAGKVTGVSGTKNTESKQAEGGDPSGEGVSKPSDVQVSAAAQQQEVKQTAGGEQVSESERQTGEELQTGEGQSAVGESQKGEGQQAAEGQQTGEGQQAAGAQQPKGDQPSDSKNTQTTEGTAAAGETVATSAKPEVTQTSQPVSGAVAYVIQPKDTLTAISIRQYGTDIRVADICNLNKISDPDDIKEGQVIMLPK
ncbi:MAG: LysM peptidoglycan-binding domain-containing protein [Butyrivibrio sp.]|nr:LysM peptidoglycan-binding domain-containing protein [Muribaculum sp.]MCM1552517.1 LysM peptidoglycan-binding domain-containing protein [Butyrivibrio sp.]